MRMRRALLAGVAAWLAVVLVGATVVWAVISRAGQELSSGDGFARAGSAASSAPGPRTVPPGGPLVKHTHRPRVRPSKPASPSSAPATSAAPTEDATHTGAPASTSPPKSTSPPPPSGSTKHSATWSEDPGRVKATCDGAQLRLDSLVPNPGWGFEKPELKSSSAEVHFHKEQGDREVELTVFCQAGYPKFDTHGDGD